MCFFFCVFVFLLTKLLCVKYKIERVMTIMKFKVSIFFWLLFYHYIPNVLLIFTAQGANLVCYCGFFDFLLQLYDFICFMKMYFLIKFTNRIYEKAYFLVKSS